MYILYFCLFCLCLNVLAVPVVNLKKNEEEDDDIVSFPNRLVHNKTLAEILREHTKEYWNENALKVLQRKLHQKLNENVARNVILFLGDGMSLPTIAATRVYIGGEEQQLSFEKFPFTGLSKTYCIDHQTADSACSATAYLCGVKANLGTIGVSAAVNKKNCTAMREQTNHVNSLARLFQLKGKSTGLVTTMRVTHASPAGVYAHTAYRRWESDNDVLTHRHDPHLCEDIGHQLIFGETGRNLQVILGGGRNKLLPKEIQDISDVPGERNDQTNLIEEWKKLKTAQGAQSEYIWNREQLLNVQNNTKYLLGLFEPGHMKYNLDRNKTMSPSLSEMTAAALNILNKDQNGFFLFVEGGKIDSAHHFASAHKALDETSEFSKAVETAVKMTSDSDTLIVVTSDHAHTMSYAGYAERGSDVFGYAGKASDENLYTILNYANGPGYKIGDDGQRYVPSEAEMNEIGFKWPSATPLKKETHGADDVGIFAKGPWAHLFTGVMEQNVIPHLIAFASCVSEDIQCDEVIKNSK